MFTIRNLFLGLISACFLIGNAAATISLPPLAPYNSTTQELKHSPQSFQLAKSTFLPETYDDLGLSGRDNTKYDHNSKNCTGYKLTTCPSNATCSSCPFNRKLKKISSCKSGYTLSSNSCIDTEFCRTDSTTYKNSIPSGYTCTDITKSSTNADKCFTGCSNINCSGYPLDCNSINKPAMNIKTTETCPDCTNPALSNCSKTFCKITACADGYKIANGATECIPLDNTCASGYYKESECNGLGFATPQVCSSNTESGDKCCKCKVKVLTCQEQGLVSMDACYISSGTNYGPPSAWTPANMGY